MKIKETIERECCQLKDLKKYCGIGQGDGSARMNTLVFCMYCGQLWDYICSSTSADQENISNYIKVRPMI